MRPECHRNLDSGFDLQQLTAGYSKCEGVQVGSATVQLVCEEYATRRKQFKKSRLNWRVSNPKSAKRSLGWVPFKAGGAKYKAGQVAFLGHKFSLWDSYGLSRFDLRAGSFSQDARGRWYLNVCVKVDVPKSEGTGLVGIDLGLKTAATCSDGEELASGLYRKHEQALGIAQRARKKGRVRTIHAKIANTRKDEMHKFSTGLVARNAAIFVGNVQASAMVKTKMAKSTLDAGWSMLKTMLEYKSHGAGIVFEEVNEAYTTFALPLNPTPAASAGCVPMGVIGVAVNNTLVGYALDGFGIYSGHDDNGKEITNADLDECHGRVSPVQWNGQRVAIYHYVMTREYPYTLGCYRGIAVSGRMHAGPEATLDAQRQSVTSCTTCRRAPAG